MLFWSNILIAIFGVLAVWLSQHQDARYRKWSSVMGLIGQPFWFIISIVTDQWGLFFLSCLYTLVWGQGFYNYWVKEI